MKIIKKKNLILILLISVFLLIPLFFAYFVSHQSYQSIKSQAQEEDLATFCKNHCQASHGNQPHCRGKPDFYDEECCLRIQQTGDPTECPWPQRGWCMPEHCASIPEGVNNLRCAAPRQSWCDMCKRCFTSFFTPAPSLPPTQPPPNYLPLPTALPTSSSHQLPPPQTPLLPLPTNMPVFPTTKIVLLPTEEPPSLSTPGIKLFPYDLQLPQVHLPTMVIKLEKVQETIEKPLGFFRWLVNWVKYYDRRLETFINSKISELISNIQNPIEK